MALPALQRHSRYRGTDIHRDDGVIDFGEWKPPVISSVNERLYVVTQQDVNRPDLIAYRFYGATELWWVAPYYNNVPDPWTFETGDRLRMPTLDAVLAGLSAVNARDFTAIPQPGSEREKVLFRPRIALPYTPPPYRSPYLDDSNELADPTTEAPWTFQYAFPAPYGTGFAHLQIQVSENADFVPVVTAKMTAVTQLRWFYYNPLFNSGAGGFQAFPQAGINLLALEGQTIYYSFNENDGIERGQLYYIRHRAIVDQVEQDWTAAPPTLIP